MSPDLNFTIEGAQAVQHAAAPHIGFKLRLVNSQPQTVHSVMLKCQIQLDVARRRYSAIEQQRLSDLFGEPGRWSETLRSFLWVNTTVFIGAFQQDAAVEVQVPCSFDFNIAATKYFSAIEDEEIPLSFFFSGTIFYQGDGGVLQVAQISWDKEASYRMPVRVWREMMDAYYPDSVWLCLRRQAFDRLYQYKVEHGMTSVEEALLSILEPKAAVQSQ